MKAGTRVEVAVAVLAVVAGAAALASPAAAAVLLPSAPGALVVLALWIAAVDAATLTIPDGAVIALAAIALPLRLAAGAGVLELTLDLALSGGLLYAVREAFWRLRGLDALGLGDVKLGAAGGLLVGASGFSVALLAASLTGLALFALRAAVLRIRWARGQKLPFGALLAPAIVLVFLLG